MFKSLFTMLMAVFSLCLAAPANSAIINILDDYTSAHAQVTYDPGVVSNPGTTLSTFSGPLFPSALFTGYHLVGDRTAIVPIDEVYFDTTAYSAVNYADLSAGFYRFCVILGWGVPGIEGATGNASAETDLNLRFQVMEGDSSMDLYASMEGAAPVSLALFDETVGVTITSLAPYFDHEEVEVSLLDGHIYSLTGSLYAFTPLAGDPTSYFGFRFNDELAVAAVPEPETISLLLLGLIALGWSYRRPSGYSTE
ncbi:MAG: PEP-CTERM sorting domain-containing protein [Candidatus Thiodiazotropha sp.]